jgi:hypothetical protein
MTWDTQPVGLGGVNPFGTLDRSGDTVIATGSSTARSLAVRFAEVYNVKDYGAVGDGTTDDAAAIRAALAAASGGGTVLFPTGTYLASSAITGIWNHTTLYGLGDVWIKKGFSGNLFTVDGAYIKFLHINVDAEGETYTGPVVRYQANSNRCEWAYGDIEDGADSIFLLEDAAGSQSAWHDFFYILSASNLAAGACVKRTVSVVDTSASPRHFHHIIGGASSFFMDVNGLFTGYLDHVYTAGVNLGDNCLGVTINNCRLALPAARTATLSGNSVLVTNCEIGGTGTLVIDADFLYGQFVNNVMDPSTTFTDNSIKTAGATQPLVEDPRLATGRQVLVVATANLPAAAATMDGRILIEDAGAGNRNLIVYAGGQRFRIDGGANV